MDQPSPDHADGVLWVYRHRPTGNGADRVSGKVIVRYVPFDIDSGAAAGMHPLGCMPAHFVILRVHQFDMPLTPRSTMDN